MQDAPQYGDVVVEVRQFLAERMDACRSAGIPDNRLLIDPGFGFGKSLAHNLSLLKHLRTFSTLHAPILVGISRKSMIGSLLGGAPVQERISGGLAAAIQAVNEGAAMIRTHDVRETADALKVVEAVFSAE
jgi:dihydropteroate synthase